MEAERGKPRYNSRLFLEPNREWVKQGALTEARGHGGEGLWLRQSSDVWERNTNHANFCESKEWYQLSFDAEVEWRVLREELRWTTSLRIRAVRVTLGGLLESAQGAQRSFGADPLLLAVVAGLFWLPTASAPSEKLSQFKETRGCSPSGPGIQARTRRLPEPKSSHRGANAQKEQENEAAPLC